MINNTGPISGQGPDDNRTKKHGEKAPILPRDCVSIGGDISNTPPKLGDMLKGIILIGGLQTESEKQRSEGLHLEVEALYNRTTPTESKEQRNEELRRKVEMQKKYGIRPTQDEILEILVNDTPDNPILER